MILVVSIALAAAMLAVLATLFFGLYSMTRGGEFAIKHGNRFMRARVLSQALAVSLFLLLLLLRN